MADNKTKPKPQPISRINNDEEKKSSPLGVYLYIPNIIGYVRILMNCYAFAICFDHRILFSSLYLISFVCDALDGWFARRFNQVSTFGAVLDMVTDRVSTACLLLVLSQLYGGGGGGGGLIFLSLLALDIASHWFQMYSTFLLGKSSHKDVRHSSSWLFRLYYGNRTFMGFCCVSCEVLYITLFLLAGETHQMEGLIPVLRDAVFGGRSGIAAGILVVAGFGWAIKQLVNLIQLKSAADVCVLHDIKQQ